MHHEEHAHAFHSSSAPTCGVRREKRKQISGFCEPAIIHIKCRRRAHSPLFPVEHNNNALRPPRLTMYDEAEREEIGFRRNRYKEICFLPWQKRKLKELCMKNDSHLVNAQIAICRYHSIRKSTEMKKSEKEIIKRENNSALNSLENLRYYEKY